MKVIPNRIFELEKKSIMNAKFNDIINGNDLVLVDFYADWCGPCKMMSPILQEVKLDLKDAVKIIKVNVDQHQDLASHFMVRGVPTLMLFKTGKMLWRQSGVLSAKDLTTIISNHLN
ncbi:MAG: thioredoxin [Flavobacterium sp.]|nr:MAG: thioredoxin [Flavobacterium sp.]